MKPRLRIIIADDNRDVTSILAGTFGLKGYEVHKTYSAEECLNKVNELDGKVDIVFVDGKIAADRAAILIIKVKRINSDIRIMALAEDENDKTRVLDCGADEFATKPISAETIVAMMIVPLVMLWRYSLKNTEQETAELRECKNF